VSIINILRKFINPLGIDIIKYPELDLRRRKKLLEHHKITKILDVGANEGQYAEQTQKLGFKGGIISFEPVKSVFEKLNKKTQKNRFWSAYNYGLGNKNEQVLINISKNTFSSSLLEIMPNHVKGAPESKYTHQEKVIIKTLDEVYNEIVDDSDVVFLKIDVQGFERNVIEGSKNSLKFIKGIQLEMSLEELYKGEMLFDDTIKLLKSEGFNLHSLENGFYNDETGKLLQVDGFFFKNND
jgi:FkbM family methyltransferase